MSIRITGGIAKGIILKVPKKTPVRPALSKIRAAIFSSLGNWIEGKKVVDLFAGSGSLGIEALSRGALSCTFIDKSKECIECIKINLKKAHLEGVVILEDVYKFLKLDEAQYDLIFASPPYFKESKPLDDPLFSLVYPRLNPDGIFIYEFFSKNIIQLSDSWTIIREKSAGETKVWILKPVSRSG
ncbi:RsmD family RNA methyltransferase [Candidatus Methylacidiphilum infernorum]|uniref:RsmD family RNA methyltransferase n=1 Tax=Candidatus Methylacidiphilum infernorum TaxID=511746 RepID=A0ABX7PUS5_9BACT|nr:RsmD family RNA methyltransferase [Candidatus Methylacidiphilum infernorum]QSR86504.1 RsmD family RNA methyltransferase [Candidatus Methylacidiphilum infernorum]